WVAFQTASCFRSLSVNSETPIWRLPLAAAAAVAANGPELLRSRVCSGALPSSSCPTMKLYSLAPAESALRGGGHRSVLHNSPNAGLTYGLAREPCLAQPLNV